MDQLKMYDKLLKIKKNNDRPEYPFNLTNIQNIVFTKKQVQLYEDKECKNVQKGGVTVFL
jgi:hypothetical protein